MAKKEALWWPRSISSLSPKLINPLLSVLKTQIAHCKDWFWSLGTTLHEDQTSFILQRKWFILLRDDMSASQECRLCLVILILPCCPWWSNPAPLWRLSGLNARQEQSRRRNSVCLVTHAVSGFCCSSSGRCRNHLRTAVTGQHLVSCCDAFCFLSSLGSWDASTHVPSARKCEGVSSTHRAEQWRRKPPQNAFTLATTSFFFPEITPQD